MSEPTKTFSQSSIHVFLFCLFLVFFTWPFMTIADQNYSQYTIFVYAFVVWLSLVIVLFIIGANSVKNATFTQDEDV
ncbi:MAG: hypothetical protein JRD47_02725 [Deltaproteobacteria bacterium]|nr:hypothetical protein [Deltaproteobacteria bacterium]